MARSWRRVVACAVVVAATTAPIEVSAAAPAAIPGYAPVSPADGAAVPRSGEMTFTVHAGQQLYAASLVVSSQPTVDPQSGMLTKESWVMPPAWWPSGVHMQQLSTSPPTYSYDAYDPFLLRPGTYYWQVTASLSDPYAASPDPVVGPVETLTVNGPDLGPPVSGPTSGWGGPTSGGFPGQRLPIAFRVTSDSQTVSNVAYGARMFCEGIPEAWETLGGEVAASVPLAGGAFDLLAWRVDSVLHVNGAIDGQKAHGTLDGQRGPGCHTPQTSWSAGPAYAGTSSQHLPVVGLVTRRQRIDRLMLVWRSDCVLPFAGRPKAQETLWLDLPRLRVRGGKFALQRVFRLRDAEGSVFRVSADLHGRLGTRLYGAFTAQSRRIEPNISDTRPAGETCRSGKVEFAVAR